MNLFRAVMQLGKSLFERRSSSTRATTAKPAPDINSFTVGGQSEEVGSRTHGDDRNEHGPETGPSIEQLHAELLKEPPSAEKLDTSVETDKDWVNVLAGSGAWHAPASPALASESSKRTRALALSLFDLLSGYASHFNCVVGFPSLRITPAPPKDIVERVSVRKGPLSSVETTEPVSFLRWRLSTRSRSLSCRARDGIIELYLVAPHEVMALSEAEHPENRRLKLCLSGSLEKPEWTIDGLPACADDLRVAAKQLFKEMVRSTHSDLQPVQDLAGAAEIADEKLAGSISRLFLERQNLAQKVVIQQEEIQRRIARDLHDAVISEVMALKRTLSGGSGEGHETANALDTIVQRLREICYDLSPRDLSDWGLPTVVEDMLEQMSQRTGADCVMTCDEDLPVLPAPVELHIYRIIQESLTNIEKYSCASRISVTMSFKTGKLMVKIEDNGKGFDPSQAYAQNRTTGYGMSSLKERIELIRCFHPATIDLESQPGSGTSIRLSVSLED